MRWACVRAASSLAVRMLWEGRGCGGAIATTAPPPPPPPPPSMLSRPRRVGAGVGWVLLLFSAGAWKKRPYRVAGRGLCVGEGEGVAGVGRRGTGGAVPGAAAIAAITDVTSGGMLLRSSYAVRWCSCLLGSGRERLCAVCAVCVVRCVRCAVCAVCVVCGVDGCDGI